MTEQTIEEKAKAMGWAPQEEFKGDPEKFISAEDFVRRGEEFLPIVKANNRKLEKELTEVKGQLQSMTTMLRAGQETIAELKRYNSEVALNAAKAHRKELAAALKEARESGDTEKEVEINDQLTETREAISKAEEGSKAPAATTQPTDDPVMRQWKADNPWYGTDIERTAVANAMSTALRAEGEKSTGREFLDKVLKRTQKFYKDEGQEPPTGKVAEGARPNGGGSEGGKTYASLPADAKAACDRMGAKLIGEGRAFKNVAEWRKKYAADYFATE